jgi:hypothetical protein
MVQNADEPDADEINNRKINIGIMGIEALRLAQDIEGFA